MAELPKPSDLLSKGLPKPQDLLEKKNLVESVAPTTSRRSSAGLENFLPQVDTEVPSVLTPSAQKLYKEKERIGKRFETTLLNIPTQFGRVGGAMKAAKQIQKTLPEVPSLRKYGEIPRMQPTAMTEGQLLGESLTKGTDFRELTTDKFTEKKTALQKQIENAENAYRTYQGDEMADQARAQSGKEPMAFEGGYENIAPLLSGIQGTVSSFYKIPRYIYNVFAIPQNLVADLGDIPGLQANYENVSKGTFNPLAYLEYAGDYTKGQEEKWQSRQRQYDEGVFDQLANGDFPGAGLQIYDNVIGSAPSIAAMFVSGGAANAAKLGSISSKIATALPFASAQNQALLENENIPEWLKPVNAAFNGLSEILLEGKFGTTAILKGATKVIAEQGADVAAKSIKDLAYNYIKKVLSKVQPVTDVVSNAAEEMATTLSQNFIAIATGEDPNRGIMDGVADAGIVGGAQGLGASAIRKGIDIYKNRKSKDKVEKLSKQRDDIVNDLDNEAIPDTVKEQLEVKLEAITEEINNTLDENRNDIKNLPEEVKLEVAELADKIENIKEYLQNEFISETTKAILEQDLKDAQAELDAKFKLSKPTFDTEASLIAEGKAAEEEYKKTGDQVTYEQKIKEIEEREKNLVPEPEGVKDYSVSDAINQPKIFTMDGEKGSLYTEENGMVVFESNDRVTELGNIDEISNKKISELGLKEESELNIQVGDDNSVNIDGNKLFNNYSDPMAAINYDKEGNVISINLETDNQQKRTIRGQRAQEIAYQYTLKSFEENATDSQIEQAVQQARELESTEGDVSQIASTEKVAGVEPEIEKVEQLKLKEDAIQVETAGEVPVQPEATVGEEVEQGKPEAKPEGLTQEGKQEEVKIGKVKQILSSVNGDISRLAGDSNASKRAFIIEAITGQKVSKANAGVNKLKEVVKAYVGITPDSVRGEYDQINQWAKGEKEATAATQEAQQTPAQKVEQLRAKEQAEYAAMDDPTDKAKREEIYDKYDKLITPLLPEVAPAKTKPAPRLKAKVNTKVLFEKAVNLFYDISGTEGSAKKRTLSAKRRTFMEQNPSIKYVDDNWSNISKQLEAKGLLKKEGNCP